MATDPIVIVAHARTPMGAFQGAFTSLTASDLGAEAIKAVLERSRIAPEKIDEVIMGNVLTAGQSQAPARQAAIKAGLPEACGATTVNKMCASGLKSIMYAHDQILAGSADIMIAGGMESMTNAPYLLPKARGGMRMGNAEVVDSMFLDGLTDAYGHKLMGFYADDTATHYQFTREMQDDFAINSIRKAKKAQESGAFDAEIVPVEVAGRKGSVTVSEDEGPQKAMPEKIPNLKPAFNKDGTVTAANASSINDGAAAVLVMKLSKAEELGLTPIAKIVAHTTHAQQPQWFTTAPVGAVKKLFDKTGWDTKSVDLFEVNEAFAVVTMAAQKELDIPDDKVNIHGGACVLGHPIGASGTRITSTLLAAMEQRGVKTGIATLCIGGGEGAAIGFERF